MTSFIERHMTRDERLYQLFVKIFSHNLFVILARTTSTLMIVLCNIFCFVNPNIIDHSPCLSVQCIKHLLCLTVLHSFMTFTIQPLFTVIFNTNNSN